MSDHKVCGTGLFPGPKPGDPDNNVSLRVTPVFGGLSVDWTYPGTNAHAVAHTRVYRSTSGTDVSPPQVAVVSASHYYDLLSAETAETYYYWIEIVSVNGTVGERIGPASGTTRPMGDDLLESLTGRIDQGVLAQTLKEEIGRIQLNKLGIDQELLERAASDESLAASLVEMQAVTDGTRALLQQEALARAEADAAFVSTVNTLYATVNDNTAAIQEEKVARVSADEALAQSLDTTQAQLGNNIASVEQEMRSWVNYMGDELDDIGALWTAKVDVNGMVGGFGVYNDGRTVQAGFDVDQFWVGRTSYDKVKPFIVSGSKTYIADAMIRNASIDSAKIKDAAITQAKIGTASVDTLQIKGQAVTIPVASYTASSKTLDDYWRTIAAVYMNPNGGNVQVTASFAFTITSWYKQGGLFLEVRIWDTGSIVWGPVRVAYSSSALRQTMEGGWTQYTYYPESGAFSASLSRGGSNSMRDFTVQARVVGGYNIHEAEVSNRFVGAVGLKR